MGGNNEKRCSMSKRDAASGALIVVQDARRALEEGWLGKADEDLAVAQRLMIDAGAKDIGPITPARELSKMGDRIRELEQEIQRKEREIERKEKTIEDQTEFIKKLDNENREFKDESLWGFLKRTFGGKQ